MAKRRGKTGSRTSKFKGKVRNDSERQKRENSGFGHLMLPNGVQIYSPIPGKREKFDILPYIVSCDNHPDKDEELEIAMKDDIWYKRPFKVHKGVGGDNETIVCPTTFGNPCPICEYKKLRAKEGATKEELDQYKISKRNLYVVIPKDNTKLEEVPHIFDFSQYNFQNLLNAEIEEDESYEVFPDLECGLTLKVRWEEKTFGKFKFAEAGRIDFLERDEPYSEDILDGLPKLDECLKELSYKEIEAKFFETGEEEEEETEEKPKKNKSNSTKRNSKKEPEPESEEEEEKTIDLEWEDIKDMDITELCDVVEEYELETDPDEFEEVDELQKAIAKELEIEIPKAKTKASKTTKRPTKPTKETKKGKCPHGYQFGVDVEKYEECDDCPLWDDCMDKSEEG